MFSDEQLTMMFSVCREDTDSAKKFKKICKHKLMQGWDLGAFDLVKMKDGWFGVLEEVTFRNYEREHKPETYRNWSLYKHIDWDAIEAPDTESENFETQKEVAKKVKQAKELGQTSRAPVISAYKILSDKTTAGLSKQVKDYINSGYQPFGGVSAAAFGMSPVGGNKYIQAMVRYKK